MSCNWPEFQLSEKCTIKSSTRIFKKEYVEYGVPFMRSKDVIDKALGVFSHFELFISKERYQEIKKKYGSPQTGDLLISSVGNRSGWPYIVQGEGDFYFKDGNVIWMSQFNGLDPDFLAYWLKSDIGQAALSSIMIGSAQKALTIDSLRKLWVRFPLYEYQQLSSNVLKLLDKKIAANKETNQTLEEMAQAIFKSWFVDFDPVKAKMRGEQPEGMDAATAALFPDKLVESELGLIPDGWKVEIAQDLFEVRDGTHDSPKKAEKGHYLVTSKHITKGKVDTTSAYLISEDDFKKINLRSKVDTFDILLTMIGTVGEVVVVYDNPVEFAIKNVGLFKTSQKPELVWLFYWHLQSSKMKHYLEVRMAGTTQQYLTLKTLRTTPVIIPSNEILNRFNEVISPLMEKISNHDGQNKSLSSLRDTLLPKLLSGEIVLGGG